MKRIVLFMAAVAALASCVKENNPAVEQKGDGLVTIKAVATSTKTVLNDTDVTWEGTDQIKVVLDLQTDELQDFAASTVAGSTATFNGQFASDVASATQAYAVYPNTAVTMNSINASISHTIDSEQYGNIESGDNLSYALLEVEDLAAGNATTTFNNVYSLIRVTVPEGLTEVTFASESALAGTAPFHMFNGVLKVNTAAWLSQDQKKDIRLSPQVGEYLEEKTHDILIFPGTHALTITLNDGTTTYEKTIPAKEYAASTYYNLDLKNVLSAPVTEYLASPFGGGTIEIPFVTNIAVPSYEVEIENGDGWLSKVDVKALTEGMVTLLVASGENNTSDRTATVTVKENVSGKSMVVSVTQKCVVTELLGDYMESYTQSYVSKFGTMTIARSDDYTKGVYKITLCGGDYYADYEADDDDDDEYGTLICHSGNGYSLKVAPDFSQLAADNLGLSGGDVSAYSALKSLGEPELNSEELALIGDYDETFWYSADGYNSVDHDNDATTPNIDEKRMTSSLKGMNIQKSEDLAYGKFKVKCLTYGGYSYTAYATYADGRLTVNVGKTIHQYFNTLGISSLDPIVFTVESGKLMFDSWSCKYMYSDRTVEDYVATKVADEPENPEDDPIAGTWTLTAGEKGSIYGKDYAQIANETMVISGSDGNYVIETIAGQSYNLNVQLDGTILSGSKNNSTLSFTYDSQSNTLIQDQNVFQTWDTPVLKGIIATRQGGAVVDITGTYTETGKYGSSSYLSNPFNGSFSITENADAKGQYVISGMFDIYGMDSGSIYYANFADGVLTILSANSDHPQGVGSLPADIQMTYSNGTFTMNEATCVGYMTYIGEYTGTKQ